MKHRKFKKYLIDKSVHIFLTDEESHNYLHEASELVKNNFYSEIVNEAKEFFNVKFEHLEFYTSKKYGNEFVFEHQRNWDRT